MTILTNEQIEAKMQQLKKLAEEARELKNELLEAGALPLDDDDLEQAAGGKVDIPVTPPIHPKDDDPEPEAIPYPSGQHGGGGFII